MRRLVHISDLHFGRTDPDLVDAMLGAIAAARPDLVVASGDLTQRARTWQFREARAFLDRLPAPWLAVPGNHDVPLENLGMRVADPFRRYRRHIAAELEPCHQDAKLAVVGINTTDPLAWQRGRIRPASLERACRRLRAAGATRLRVVVAHHPLEHLPGERKELIPGAATALAALSRCGAQIVLCGHLHSWRAAPFALPEGAAGMLQIQAGTGLSTRLRGEANDFNLLTLDREEITVERFGAEDESAGFHRLSARHFRLSAAGQWQDVSGEREDRPADPP